MPTSEDLAASRALMERHLLVRAVDEDLLLPTSGSDVCTLWQSFAPVQSDKAHGSATCIVHSAVLASCCTSSRERSQSSCMLIR